MSDNEREEVTLSPEDVVKFLTKVGADKPCPFCGSDNWRAPGGTDILSHVIPWSNAKGEMYMNGTPLFVMVCARCSFVRSHAFSATHVKSVIEGSIDGD